MDTFFIIVYALILCGLLYWRITVLCNKREEELKKFYKKQLIAEMERDIVMSAKFFCNKDCEYYPCHKGLSEINCLFCFCPLYRDENCGGNFTVLSNGIKDCSNCIFPHVAGNYDKIIERLK